MTNAVSPTEVTQLLLREIGRDRVQSYLAQRLDAGISLPSRPLMIRAYVKLAGQDAFPLLKATIKNPAEQEQSRRAAVQAIAEVMTAQKSVALVNRSVSLLLIALHDESEMVRSAAAVALVQSGSKRAAIRLNDLLGKQQLDSFAEREVQAFLEQSNIREYQAELFVGRESELRELSQKLTTSARIIGVQGLPGVGKTSLVRQFANQANYGQVLWLHGNAISSDELASWVPSVERAAKKVLGGKPVLIVADDFEAVKNKEQLRYQLSSLVANYQNLHCILVSRSHVNLTRFFPELYRLILSPLSDAEASDYIQLVLAEYGLDDDPSVVSQLTALAAGNPLLLNVLVNAYQKSGIVDLPPERADMINWVFERSMDRLSVSQRLALEILAQIEKTQVDWRERVIANLFASENISHPEEPFQRLAEFGLIHRKENSTVIQLHPLIREWVRSRADKRTVLRVNKRLASYYEHEDPLLAARHWISAGETRKALELVLFTWSDTVNTDRASELDEVLTRLEDSIRLYKSEYLQITHDGDDVEPSTLRARLRKLEKWLKDV